MNDNYVNLVFYGYKNKKCKNLNANERFYAELLAVLISNPNFLILDEPTVFLSEEERKKLYNAIKTNCNDSLNKLCIILITHKIEEAKNWKRNKFQLLL